MDSIILLSNPSKNSQNQTKSGNKKIPLRILRPEVIPMFEKRKNATDNSKKVKPPFAGAIENENKHINKTIRKKKCERINNNPKGAQ